ncbi:MAG: sulfotransferase [Rhizomicrobium sp.]|nr:sulfotransferase [Rhizomicrobium sp.]
MASPEQLFQSATFLHSQSRLREAEEKYRALLAVAPNHGAALHRLGLVCIQAGRLEEAKNFLQRAAAAAPADAAVHHHLGLLLLRLGFPSDAAREAEAALERNPDLAEAWSTLGAARTALGETDKALACLNRAIALSPDDPEIFKTLGQVALQRDLPDAALDFFDKALARQPRAITAQLGRAEALAALGRQGDALVASEEAIRLDPGYANAIAMRGSVLKQLGRLTEAENAFAHAVQLAPEVPAFHRALGETRRYGEGDPRLPPLERLLAREDRLPAAQKVELHFAMFKAYDDLARHQEAFQHVACGNAIYRQTIPYDEAGVFGFFDELKNRFPAGQRVAANATEQPVFIVGMPRSGTSLVEQMLASHPQVFGAGERTWFGDLIGEMLPGYPQVMPSDGARQLGARYSERLRALAPGAARITDKLPANFRHLGLIHQSLPNAKILHIQRDARDTCFSCYSKLFRSGLNFAYELGELGRYYNAYEVLMTHWRTALPADRLLEIQYETLVADFEHEAKRIVEFCGLNWNAACLRFYENKRAVRTLSEFQVRRPLFSDSIGRWRAYQPWLGPLLDALS